MLEIHNGYSLKYGLLKILLRDQGINDLIVVSNLLHLRVSTLKSKLRRHKKFNKEQISGLVYFLGAANAFKVIYFPTLKIKRKIYWEVFGKYKQKEDSFE